jgi:hypothetical protein
MIIDFHTHIYPPDMKLKRLDYAQRDPVFAQLFTNPKSRLVTAEELVAAMDEAEIEQAVVLNVGWTTSALCRETNDYILDAAVRYPKRFVPFCSVQPRILEESVSELERCVRGGARGIGELRSDEQGFDWANRLLVKPLMDVARQRRLILTVHVSEPVGHLYPGKGTITPKQIHGLAQDYPDVRIVCAHWGGGLPFYGLMPEVLEQLNNVWFDTAASPLLYSRNIYGLVTNMVGVSKVLFGSDYPLISFGRAKGDLAGAGLPKEASESVLGGNAASLLGMRS